MSAVNKIFILLVSLYTFSFSASTLNTPLKNEQQRKNYERIQSIDTNIPPAQSTDVKTYAAQDINETVCFKTTSIVVQHMTLFSANDIKDLITPYIGRCNGIKSLHLLANSISKYYVDNGYITSRIYITPQDISDGTVELYALEGKIDSVISDSKQTAGAFIWMEGNHLQLMELESLLEQVNRLRSSKTTMNLEPAQSEGATNVILHSTSTSPLYASFGANNYGSDSTGKFQFYGGVVLENLANLSDILSININTTDKQQKGKNSLGTSLSYSLPIGRWLWETGASWFGYDQTIYGLNDSYISHGESRVYSLATNYKLFHDRMQSVELSAQLSYKKNLNRLDDVLIDPSTYDLSVARTGC